MAEFASTVVVSMLRHALAIQGIDVPAPMPSGRRTLAPEDKRALVETVLRSRGPGAILHVSHAVAEFANHPISRLFAEARSGHDLIDRWLRLERYFHSRHRSRLLDRDDHAVVMEHFDSRGECPTSGEDLVVAGIQHGLMSWAGGRSVRLRFHGTEGQAAGGWLALDGQRYRAADRPEWLSGRWTLSWRDFEGGSLDPSSSMPAPQRTADGRTLGSELVADLFATVAAEPGSRTSLAEHARARGLSRRTLQRRLQEGGWSLRQITASARIEVAARLLAETNTPIALVGLLSGYSDQPHFQREFANGLGPTPGAYRRMTALKPAG